MAALFIAGWLNKRVEHTSDLCEVDGGSLDQGNDESGKKVDSTVIPIKMGFQGLLKFCMLVRRASDLFAGGLNCLIWRAERLSQTYVRYYGLTVNFERLVFWQDFYRSSLALA